MQYHEIVRVLVFILFFLELKTTNSQNLFNINDAIVISDSKVSNRYFGYSLLLQKGNDPIVTVGAPKDRFTGTKQYGGEVFQCKINGKRTCQSAFAPSGNLSGSPNGDFLGATLDGEDHAQGLIMACSPRTPIEFASNPNKTYLYGKCIFRKNSVNLDQTFYNINVKAMRGGRPTVQTTTAQMKSRSYYLYGYGLLGFDISLYDKNKVLCAAPGLGQVGATIMLQTSKFEAGGIHDVNVLPKPVGPPNPSEESNYFGYAAKAVKSAQKNETWFVAGAPRANNLMGKVTVYKNAQNNKMEIIKTFSGDEFGSYFGASVSLVDVSNDDILDLIVGAPLTAGNTYDEGAIHFYKDLANNLKKTLAGPSSIRSRFGTCIASLGDLDLDGFNDIAVSAPYEDNSAGAVYIYKGSADGLKDKYSQRLSPALFNPTLSIGILAQGFGLGLSRGNDIDNDGHNDVAVGAYKSDKVFILRSYGIIEFQAFVTSSIKSIGDTTSGFYLQLHLNYTKRSYQLDVPSLDFVILINLDYRSEERQKLDVFKVDIGQSSIIRNYTVQLKPIGKYIDPFNIIAHVNLNNNSQNIKALGTDILEMTIPYVIGCSDKSVCLTGLSIQVKSKRPKIVLGQDHQLELEVSVSNDGDPAFHCNLIIQPPSSIQLGAIYNCQKDGDAYNCPFSDKIGTNMPKNGTYIFDLKEGLTPKPRQMLIINVNVTSFGVNKKSYKDADTVKIPVVANTTSYIVGNSNPESLDVARIPDAEDTEVLHRFTIGKLGPSPLKLQVHLLIPIVEYGGENIFNILKIQGDFNGDSLICKPSKTEITVTEDEILGQIDTEKIPHNKTILIYCGKAQDCYRFSCEGVLQSSNQLAVFTVRLNIVSRLIVKKFKYELRRRNLIAYIPVAVHENPDYPEDRIFDSAHLLIFVQYMKYVPLWIYIVGAFIGFMILILIILGLYKCSFFHREYKHLIQEEQLVLNALAEQNKCCSQLVGRKSAVEPPINKHQSSIDNEYVEF